mgnify:CR=1 FL=1
MSENSTPDTKTTKTRRLLKWLMEGLLLLSVVFLIHLWQTRDAVEGPAPPLQGQLIQGESFVLDKRDEKPLLVYFWATWCPVCSFTSDHVQSISEDHAVVTVAMQSGDNDQILQHLTDNEHDFPVISDPNGEIARSWNVRAVPTLYFLDSENRIRHVSVGYASRLPLWWHY